MKIEKQRELQTSMFHLMIIHEKNND